MSQKTIWLFIQPPRWLYHQHNLYHQQFCANCMHLCKHRIRLVHWNSRTPPKLLNKKLLGGNVRFWIKIHTSEKISVTKNLNNIFTLWFCCNIMLFWYTGFTSVTPDDPKRHFFAHSKKHQPITLKCKTLTECKMLCYFYLHSAESLNLWKDNCLTGLSEMLLENKLTLFLKYPILHSTSKESKWGKAS